MNIQQMELNGSTESEVLKMEINTRNINVDYYYPTLARVAEEAEETGIIIKPEDITFNLNDVRGAGLSFTSEYIEIETVLNLYSLAGEKQEKEVEEIKNSKRYSYIQDNYIFTITRDDYYITDNTSVSCEYWDNYGTTWNDTDFIGVAERISVIINKIKDTMCAYMLREIRKTDEEIPYIMEDIIIKVIEKPHYAGEREDGRHEFKARATDKAGSTYQVEWTAYEDWDIDTDDEKMACDWKEPFFIQLMKIAD